MRAFVLPDVGSTPVVGDVPVPEPGDGEVRVKVRAASVNGFDLAVAGGLLQGAMEHRFPVVLGKDFAGVVDAAGPGVQDYAVGDRVFGVVVKPFLGDGSFAEYVTVPVGVALARMPDGVSFAEAGALGLAGAAAADAFDAAPIAAGTVVLIAGATGGVGSQAVQLAARAGAHVVATAHTDAERRHVTGLGATATVDYTGDVPAQVRELHPDGADVVLHFAGDPAALAAAVRAGGTLVSTIAQSAEQVAAPHASFVGVLATPSPQTLDRLAAHQATRHTHVVVERTYRLDDAPDAMAHFRAGTLGKLVILVADADEPTA
jgi:NADPH:quinone reductase-like Zn-dependent oxidoreductase